MDFGRVRIEESIFKKANIYDAVYLVKILNKKGTAKDPLVFFRRETMLSPELEMHHIKSYLSEEDNKKRADQCSYNSNYYCKKEDFTNLTKNIRKEMTKDENETN